MLRSRLGSIGAVSSRSRRPGAALLALLALLLCPLPSAGHALGEDYVVLSFLERSIEGHFEVHIDDLAEKLGIQIRPDADDALADITAAADRVEAYIRSRFSLGPVGDAPYHLSFGRQGVIELPQGTFAQYYFRTETGPLPDRVAFHHSMFYEDDRLHRGLVLVEYNAKTDTTYPGEYTAMVFSATNTDQQLDLTDVPTIMTPWEMIPQGVWHIWIGIDHILFLVALMLPTVLVRGDDGWMPVERFPRALWNLLKIITVFTVAHSITLILAALDVIALPSRLVESVIALSIILVALNNVTGRVREGSLLVILALGLFHGLGFASVMGHLPFRMVNLLRIVVGFNIGVELGQVAIVAVLFPLLFLARRQPWYEAVVLRGVSVVLALVAGWWFVERAFAL